MSVKKRQKSFLLERKTLVTMSLRPWTVALTQRNDNDHDPSNACRSRRVKSSIHAHNDYFPSQNGTEKVSKVLVKCFVKQYSFMPQTVVGGIIGTYSVWQCIILYIHPNFCLPNLSLTTCWICLQLSQMISSRYWKR